jgi:AcrR family transcriptional regulator
LTFALPFINLLTDWSVLDISFFRSASTRTRKPPMNDGNTMARKPDPHKRDRIIAAALTTFAQKGYAGTRIIEVARAAGIGKGTIYEYFRSKEALFFATLEYLLADTGQQMGTLAETREGPVADRLMSLADHVIRDWLGKLELYGLVLEFWSATAALPGRRRFRDAFNDGYAAFRRLLAALIREGMSDGEFKAGVDPEKIASALIGSWDALLFQAWLDPAFDPLGASRDHMQVVVAGLRQPTESEE